MPHSHHQGEFSDLPSRSAPLRCRLRLQRKYRLGESNPRHRAENPTSSTTRPRRLEPVCGAGTGEPLAQTLAWEGLALEGEDSNPRHPGPGPGVLPLNYPQMYEQHLIQCQASVRRPHPPVTGVSGVEPASPLTDSQLIGYHPDRLIALPQRATGGWSLLAMFCQECCSLRGPRGIRTRPFCLEGRGA